VFPGLVKLGSDTCRQLIDENKSGKISFKKCKISGLMNGQIWCNEKSEIVSRFLKSIFSMGLIILQRKFVLFQRRDLDLEQECIRTDNFIRKNGRLIYPSWHGHEWPSWTKRNPGPLLTSTLTLSISMKLQECGTKIFLPESRNLLQE